MGKFFIGMALYELSNEVSVGRGLGRRARLGLLIESKQFNPLADEVPRGLAADLHVFRSEELAEDADSLRRGGIDGGVAGDTESLGPALGIQLRPHADGVYRAMDLYRDGFPAIAGGTSLGSADKYGLRGRFPRVHGNLGLWICRRIAGGMCANAAIL
jgi:hypothetical protein